MSESVTTQELAAPEKQPSDKEINFRRLEAAKEQEREARIRAEMENQFLKERINAIESSLKPPEEDPIDSISHEDFDDPERLKAKLAKERQRYRKEAEEIAIKVVEKKKDEDKKKGWLDRLKQNYSDYDKVMTQENIEKVAQSNPHFLKTVLKVTDDYDRREATYEYIKENMLKQESTPKPSIKDIVDENQKNPYYIPSSHGLASKAVDFDVSSRKAKDEAYQKLKAAQRRPITGGGFAPRS